METIEEVIKTISIEHLTQEQFVDVVGQIFKEMSEEKGDRPEKDFVLIDFTKEGKAKWKR